MLWCAAPARRPSPSREVPVDGWPDGTVSGTNGPGSRAAGAGRRRPRARGHARRTGDPVAIHRAIRPPASPPGGMSTIAVRTRSCTQQRAGREPARIGGRCTEPSARSEKSTLPCPSHPRPSRIVTDRPMRADLGVVRDDDDGVPVRRTRHRSDNLVRERLSNWDVGSSASSSPGRHASATASASRCRSAGDSCPGRAR